MRTVYIFGAGASAAEGAPVVQFSPRIAYRHFKEEQEEPGLEIVWEFLEHFYGGRTAIKSAVDLDRYPESTRSSTLWTGTFCITSPFPTGFPGPAYTI